MACYGYVGSPAFVVFAPCLAFVLFSSRLPFVTFFACVVLYYGVFGFCEFWFLATMVFIAYFTFGDAGVEYLVGYLFSQFFCARILIVDEDSRIKRKNINHQQEDKHEHKTTKQHRTAISNNKNKNTKEQL